MTSEMQRTTNPLGITTTSGEWSGAIPTEIYTLPTPPITIQSRQQSQKSHNQDGTTTPLSQSGLVPPLSRGPSFRRGNSADSNDSDGMTPGFNASPDPTELEVEGVSAAFQDSLSAWLERSRTQMRLTASAASVAKQSPSLSAPSPAFSMALPLTRSVTATTPSDRDRVALLMGSQVFGSKAQALSAKHGGAGASPVVSTPTTEKYGSWSSKMDQLKAAQAASSSSGRPPPIAELFGLKSEKLTRANSISVQSASVSSASASSSGSSGDKNALGKPKPMAHRASATIPAASSNKRSISNPNAIVVRDPSPAPLPTAPTHRKLPLAESSHDKNTLAITVTKARRSPSPLVLSVDDSTPAAVATATVNSEARNSGTESHGTILSTHGPQPSQGPSFKHLITAQKVVEEERALAQQAKMRRENSESPQKLRQNSNSPKPKDKAGSSPGCGSGTSASTATYATGTTAASTSSASQIKARPSTRLKPHLAPFSTDLRLEVGKMMTHQNQQSLTPALFLQVHSPKDGGAQNSSNNGSHRRSPSAQLPSQYRDILERAGSTSATASSASVSGNGSGSHHSSQLGPPHHALKRSSLSSPSHVHHGGNGPSISPGSGGNPAPSFSRTDSLEDAWRRKIVLNMNLPPQPDSAVIHRSPLSGAVGGGSGGARSRKAARSQPASPNPQGASIVESNGAAGGTMQFPVPVIGRAVPKRRGTSAREREAMVQEVVDGAVATIASTGTTSSFGRTTQVHTPVSPLTAQSNAVLGAMPAIARIPSDSVVQGSGGRSRAHSNQQVPAPSPKRGQIHSPSIEMDSDEPVQESVSNLGGNSRSSQQVDWSELCRSLTGEDLDVCEIDAQQHIKEYYGAQMDDVSSSSNTQQQPFIDSLDDSIRDMESRKAITLRVRKVGWVITLAFFFAFIGSIGLLIGSDRPYIPIAGCFYFVGFMISAISTPILGRQTKYFKPLPLLSLQFLHRALNGWAIMTCIILFVGSIEFSGSSSLLPSQVSISQSEGWSRWIMCSLPLFVGYLQHDLHSGVASIWCVVAAVMITTSHCINELWIGSVNAHTQQRGIPRSGQWSLELIVQLLFLVMNWYIARAATLSIQSHVVQLWHREKFMLETGKYLAAEREAAFSAADQKSNFLANMSHEIRTPLNGVIGLCSLVLESELTQDQRDCLTTVIKSGETLLCIINDILLFSKLESGELLIEQLPFNPMNAVEDVMDIFALLAQQQENELVPHFKPGIACPVWGDVMRLRQVLTNLVSNALKFSKKGGEVIVTVEPFHPSREHEAPPTPGGAEARSALTNSGNGSGNGSASGVQCKGSPRSSQNQHSSDSLPHEDPSSIKQFSSSTCTQSPEEAGSMYLKFSVQDFGCGIPRSKQHRLFHAFSQVDASDTRKYGGTGLGLVICLRLVELMKGRIGFESEPGKGSTFWFWIKLDTVPPGSSDVPLNANVKSQLPQLIPVVEIRESPMHQTQQQQVEHQEKIQADTTVPVPSDLPQPEQPHPDHVTIDVNKSAEPELEQPLSAGGSREKIALQVDVASVGTAEQIRTPEIIVGDSSVQQVQPSHRQISIIPITPAIPMTPAVTSVNTPAVGGASVVPTFASQLSPSHVFNAAQQGFSRYSSKLVGKRLLIVDHHRSGLALQELAAMWGMVVSVVHTQADWDLEWASIVKQTQLAQSQRSKHSPPRGASLLQCVSGSGVFAAQSCKSVSGGAAPGPGHRSSFSYDGPVLPSANVPTMPCVYDVVLILDSMLPENFAPYAAYNQSLVDERLSFARSSSTGSAPLLETLALPQLHTSVSLPIDPSTCSTQKATPLTESRRLSVSELGEDPLTLAAASTSSAVVSCGSIVHTPLLTSLSESIVPMVSPSSPPLISQCKSDGTIVVDMMMPSAVSTSGNSSEESSGGRSLFFSASSNSEHTSPSSQSHSPSSTSTTILPAFVMLLSQTQRNARLDAAKECAGRGFASVVMKPTKWKNLLQALLKASKYKPSGSVLLKAAAVLGASNPFLTPSPLLSTHSLRGSSSCSGGAGLSHRRAASGSGGSTLMLPLSSHLSSVLEGDHSREISQNIPSSEHPSPASRSGGVSGGSLPVSAMNSPELPPAAGRKLSAAEPLPPHHRMSDSPLMINAQVDVKSVLERLQITVPDRGQAITSAIDVAAISSTSESSEPSELMLPQPAQMAPRPADYYPSPIVTAGLNTSSSEIGVRPTGQMHQRPPPSMPLVRHISSPLMAPQSASESTPRSSGSLSGTPLTQSPVFQASSRLAPSFGSPKLIASAGLNLTNSPTKLHASPTIPPVIASAASSTSSPSAPAPPVRRSSLSSKKPGSAALAAAPTNPNLRILVAEDNMINQKVVLRMLNHLGYHDITMANDGVECLQHMAKANQHGIAGTSKPFDVILMDKSMPRLGGVSTTKRIRARICQQFQPMIYALTANVLPADQLACVEAGMQAFLAKPILLPQLRSLLEQCPSVVVEPPSSSSNPNIASPTQMFSPTPSTSPEGTTMSPYTSAEPPNILMQHPSPGSSGESASGVVKCQCQALWHDSEEHEEE